MNIKRATVFALSLWLTLAAAARAAVDTDLGWRPGGQNAPSDQAYVTVGNTSALSSERALTGSSTITVTDGGANGAITLTVNGPLIQSAGGTAISSYTAGDILVANDSGTLVKLPLGSNGYVLSVNTSLNPKLQWIAAGTGSVTNFSAGDLSPLFTTSEANTTTTPALSFSLSNAAANTAFGNFTGSSAAPGFGTVSIGAGGTGQTTATAAFDALAPTTTQGDLIYFDGSDNVRLAKGTANQVLGMNNGATAPEYKTITAGTNISVTHGANSITIANTLSGTVTSVAQSLTGLPFLSISGSPITSSGTLALSASCATGDLIYGSGSNTLAKLTIGSSGNFLKVVGGVPAWAAAPSSFGGDGSDGAITISSDTTDSAIKQRNATTFIINDTRTLTVKSGAVINTTSTFTVGQGTSGILDVSADVVGGRRYIGASQSPGTDGQGPGPGAACRDLSGTDAGGGGGGCGGDGGGGSNTVGGQGGQAIPLNRAITGSGGGGGMGSGGNDGNVGGNGGGRLTVCSVGAVSIAAGGKISANGATPAVANSARGGGGGGSGGVIYIASQASITNSGTIEAKGAAGASPATGTGGGGGGGGWVILHSPSNTAGTITLTGGSAGSGGSPAAAAGSTGQSLTITGTPNLPLLVYVRDHYREVCSLPSKELNNRDVAALAGNGNLVEMAHYLSGTMTEATCEAVGDYVETEPAA